MDIDADNLDSDTYDFDCNGIPYEPIERAPDQWPHPLVAAYLAGREDPDGVWQGDAGNISVLYGPGSWQQHKSDASAFYGERHFWPWNAHGPLVHVPAGDVAGDVAGDNNAAEASP